MYTGLLRIHRTKYGTQNADPADPTGPHGNGLVLWRKMGSLIRPGAKAPHPDDYSLYLTIRSGCDLRCGRLQCPLHDSPDAFLARDLLLCAGCRMVRLHCLVVLRYSPNTRPFHDQVQYCSFHCQRE